MHKLWYKKRSSLHGSGLFAASNIKKDDQVIQYIGDKVTKKEGDRRADIQLKKAEKNKKTGMVYVFELNKKYDIDGGVLRNHARFINHSCDPNCYTKIISVDGEKKISIYSKKDIEKGEELHYDYKFPYEEDSSKKIKCYCGMPRCKGYLN